LPAVEALLESGDLSPLIRASLLAQTSNVGTRALGDVLRPWLGDPDPLIRRGAVAGTMGLPGDVRWWMLANRLADEHPGVRFEMAIALSETYPGLSPIARRTVAPLFGEYREALRASADLVASQNALARLEVQMGQIRSAERAFARALEIDSTSLRALVDFADLRRAQGREQEAGALLRRALATVPDSGTANVAYGLHLVRLNRYEDALEPLSKATRTSDAQPRFFHIYAVAQDSLGHRDQAVATLRRGIERWPWNLDLLSTLVMYLDDGRSPEVRRHLDTLRRIAPNSTRVRALLDQYRTPQ
jgi:tetratricopeptide (TPR) repeat protein